MGLSLGTCLSVSLGMSLEATMGMCHGHDGLGHYIVAYDEDLLGQISVEASVL